MLSGGESRITFYTDQELDKSTNLYNYDARLYDPVIGRFVSADTVVPKWNDPQSLNRYSYVLNNPLIYVDPNGHEVEMTFTLSTGTLSAKDVQTGESLQITGVFSGARGHRNNPDEQHLKHVGPIPVGKWLVGQAYRHQGSPGDNVWHRLYGDNGDGGYSYQEVEVKGPNGEVIIRGGFNLHTGLVSIGCVTVPSDVQQGDPDYPKSEKYNKLKKMLKETKPLEYKGSDFSGTLIVREKEQQNVDNRNIFEKTFDFFRNFFGGNNN